jgi:DNA repair protein RadC
MQLTEITVQYNPKQNASNRIKIVTSQDAVNYLSGVFNQNTINMQEQVIVLYLNRANYILGHQLLSIGGLTSTVLDVRIVLATALKCLACSIIIAHNHPSGELKPSRQDLGITHQLKKAGELLDIKLLDHFIITDGGYYSFADEGAI